MRLIQNSLIVTSFILLSGCASITGTTGQSVSVETRSSEGVVSGAQCEMANSKGKWYVQTPGSTQIRRSNDDLIVTCQKDGFEPGTQSVESVTKGSMWGNIVFGGGIGAVVDHNSGAAYEYPTLIQVVINRIRGNQSDSGHSTSLSVSPEQAQEKCLELGLNRGTEDFARCVVRLAK